MRPYGSIQKAIGETPLQALERFRNEAGIEKSVPLAYAGRLDPLASGTLIILIGDECKRQHAYHKLDKTYEFEILLQFSSDTGDVLGMAKYDPHPPALSPATIAAARESYYGRHTFPYPQYSSKTVCGKPLFLWALEGRLHEITIPSIATRIYSLSHTETYTLTRDALRHRIRALIASISPVTEPSKALGNDFRRTAICEKWDSLFAAIPSETSFSIMRMTAIVESGTYIRSLAPALAEALGTQGLAFLIHRTTVGKYNQLRMPYMQSARGSLGWWQRKL